MIWKKKKFWGTIIAVALLAFCVKDIRLEELRDLSGRINYFYLIPAVICSFLFVILKAMRWRIMVRPQKTLAFGQAVSLYSAGQVINIVMPALTGQVGRMFLFARAEGLRKTFVFSTIVLEILLDAVTMVIFLLLTSLAFVFPEEYRSASYVIGIATTATLVALYLMLHYQTKLESLGRRCLRERWPGAYITTTKFMRSFTKGIELLRSSQHMAGSLLLSAAYWAAHVFVVFFLFKSFNLGLPLAAAAIVMLINTLALMVPITPGNAGTFEVAVSTSLAAFSVGRSDAVMFAIALHLLDIVPLWIMGAGFLKSKKVTIREIQAEHDEDNVLDRVTQEGLLGEEESKI